MAWGTSTYGVTNVPAGLTDVLPVAATSTHNLALKRDGTVITWGLGSSGQTNVPAGLGNVIAVAAGVSQSLALLEVRPRISVILAAGAVQFSWPRSVSDWGVQCSTNLAVNAWTDVVTPPADDGSNLSLTITPSQPKEFFRLREP